MKSSTRLFRGLGKAKLFSPGWFVLRAFVLTALYALSRAAGLQEYTTFLSGASPDINLSWRTGCTLGLVHLLLHFTFILVVPILLITTALVAAWNNWAPGRDATSPAGQQLPDEIKE